MKRVLEHKENGLRSGLSVGKPRTWISSWIIQRECGDFTNCESQCKEKLYWTFVPLKSSASSAWPFSERIRLSFKFSALNFFILHPTFFQVPGEPSPANPMRWSESVATDSARLPLYYLWIPQRATPKCAQIGWQTRKAFQHQSSKQELQILNLWDAYSKFNFQWLKFKFSPALICRSRNWLPMEAFHSTSKMIR